MSEYGIHVWMNAPRSDSTTSVPCGASEDDRIREIDPTFFKNCPWCLIDMDAESGLTAVLDAYIN
jgi:hypothetical protein